jgi:hypothetical protein
MKTNNSNHNESTGGFYIVPKEFLETLSENQNKILALLNKEPNSNAIGNYISESEAKKLLNRATTWFWTQRKEGKLLFTKVGRENYYKLEDLISFIESSRSIQEK